MGVSGPVYVPLCPGQSTFRKDSQKIDKIKWSSIFFSSMKTEVSGSLLRVFEIRPMKLTCSLAQLVAYFFR